MQALKALRPSRRQLPKQNNPHLFKEKPGISPGFLCLGLEVEPGLSQEVHQGKLA